MTKAQKVLEALERAKETGEVFLVRLNKKELEKAGFDTSTFGEFSEVNVYLQYWDGEFTLKYEFDNDPAQVYYERSRDVGGSEYILEDAVRYLRIAQEDPNDDPRGELEEPSLAVVSMVESHLISPDDGSVFIYKVAPQPVKGGMRMEVFYICTLDNHVNEIVWGSGPTPRDALINAVLRYSSTGVGDDENPFQKVYDEVYASPQDP